MNLTIELPQQAENVVLRVLHEAIGPAVVAGAVEYDSWSPGLAEYESWSHRPAGAASGRD